MNHTLVKESCSNMRRQARELLRGKWKNAMLISLVYYLAISGVTMVITQLFGNPLGYPDMSALLVSIYALLVAGPLSFGFITCFRRIANGEQASIGDLFCGFEDFGKLFLVNLLMMIFIFLWSLLLIIPGIIASLAYSMVYFCMTDNGSLGARDAIRLSKEKMKGNKGKLFLLFLSFIGWYILVGLVYMVAMIFLGDGFDPEFSEGLVWGSTSMYIFSATWVIGQIFGVIVYVVLTPYVFMSQLVFYHHLTDEPKLSLDHMEPDHGFQPGPQSEPKFRPEVISEPASKAEPEFQPEIQTEPEPKAEPEADPEKTE